MALEDAFQHFSRVVGAEWASYADSDRAVYIDHFNPGPADEFMAAGFVAPASVEEVQAIVRLANEHKTPLWPVSCGRNLAYGGAAPRTKDCVILDLKRMNRVLEVNDDLAYAVVEPGVSFFDLHRHLKDNGHKLWLSVPGPGWGSVIGNALDRGAGYGLESDHFATSVGMEVVLPDGELLRTGMGAMDANPSWHVMRYGFGPMVDGLFSQSGYGVVTKMGRFLTPEPDGFMGCEVSVENEEDIAQLVEVMRPFKLNGMIDTPVVLGNVLIPATYLTERTQWHEGPGAIPDDVLHEMKQQYGIGWWNGFFALYGPEDQVRSRYDLIRAAIETIPGAKTSSRFYPRGTPIEHTRDASLSGIPHLDEFGSLNWRPNGAHIDFSPVAPLTGEHALKVYRLLREGLARHGLDYRGGIYCEARFFRMVTTLYFDKTDADETARVRAAFSELITSLAEAGYGEYRTHIAYMDEVAASYGFNDNAMRRFHERLKHAIDPGGIIAPGKSGVWGAYERG